MNSLTDHLKKTTLALSAFLLWTLIPGQTEARIAVPRPNVPAPQAQPFEEHLELAAAKRGGGANCRNGRGFSKGCPATHMPNGDILRSNGCSGGHLGCDHSRAQKKGNPPILSVGSGTVVFSGWNGSGYGNRVVVKQSDGSYITYSHLARLGVRKGMKVSKGQSLGTMGATGSSSGVHLHIEKVAGGRFVNPGRGLYGQFCGK